MRKVKSESELYAPMKEWLHQYLLDRYPSDNIITVDTSRDHLYKVLELYEVKCPQSIGIDIQIDVLGIVKTRRENKLFFIEAKKNNLNLRDLGQLWSYCKLIDPEEAFLFSAEGLGSLDKIFNLYKREDLLDFGDGRTIKKMQIAKWSTIYNRPLSESQVPKL